MIIKRGLGRGLGALLASEPAEVEALVDVPIDQIEVNPYQPRKVFDFTALDELAASIKSSGVIQPIIVRRIRAASSSRRAAVACGASGGPRADSRDRARGHRRAEHRARTRREPAARGFESDRGGAGLSEASRSSRGRRKSSRSGSGRTARRSRTVSAAKLPEEIRPICEAAA